MEYDPLDDDRKDVELCVIVTGEDGTSEVLHG
jgi:hypothetical protein